MSSSSYITTEGGGRQNLFGREPLVQVEENYKGYPQEAEKANGRWAMIGLIAGIGAYATTGQLIPGVF